VVANIFALFFTTEPDSCPIRWCKKVYKKSSVYSQLTRLTDRQTDRRKRDPNSGAFTAYRSL